MGRRLGCSPSLLQGSARRRTETQIPLACRSFPKGSPDAIMICTMKLNRQFYRCRTFIYLIYAYSSEFRISHSQLRPNRREPFFLSLGCDVQAGHVECGGMEGQHAREQLLDLRAHRERGEGYLIFQRILQVVM